MEELEGYCSGRIHSVAIGLPMRWRMICAILLKSCQASLTAADLFSVVPSAAVRGKMGLRTSGAMGIRLRKCLILARQSGCSVEPAAFGAVMAPSGRSSSRAWRTRGCHQRLRTLCLLFRTTKDPGQLPQRRYSLIISNSLMFSLYASVAEC